MSAGTFSATCCRASATVLTFLLCLGFVPAQELLIPDSVNLIKTGSTIKNYFGVMVISRDSVLLVPSLLKTTAQSNDDDARAFYDSLRLKAYRGSMGRRLYDLVVAEPGSDGDNVAGRRSIADFSPYNGLMISNIKIIRLDPFGASLDNPEQETGGRADRLLNRTHVRSRERLIAGYLMFAAGDTVSDLALSETERNLRNLAFINDVRIIVAPIAEKEAEVLVITRDDYSLGADFAYYRPEKGEISVFERNLAGFGHSIELGLPYDFDLEKPWGVKMGYRVNNIARTWVDMNLFFGSTANEKYYGISLRRDFMGIETKYAGGIDIREVSTITTTDSPDILWPFSYSYHDYWAARSFLLDLQSHSRIILGARFINNNVYERPDIDAMSFYSLQKYKLWLSSVSFSVEKFYKASFIYNYGRTEDIPYGALATFTAGYEINEFKNRKYFSGSLSWATPPGRPGYLSLSAAASAFMDGGVTEQGMATVTMNYFTDLLMSGRWRFRGFTKASFTRGFDRYTDEYLTLGKNEIVTGFRNDSLRGNQRMSLSLEGVAFSPLKIYGFRFAFFCFYDFATMGKGFDFLPGTADVHAIGAGIRIRNNNLVINTFQIRLAWYPGIPPYSDPRWFELSGEPVLKQRGFDAGPPSLLVYR